MSRATGLSPASREAVPAPADPATLPPLTEIERETARAIVDAHSPSPVAEKATKVAPFDPGKDRIEKAEAKEWQAVAKNLAQVLIGCADELEQAGNAEYAEIARTAFARQCAAHGVEVVRG